MEQEELTPEQGTPLELVNGEYDLRVRTSVEKDECRRVLLEDHFQGNH
jgi:hypothetical protein